MTLWTPQGEVDVKKNSSEDATNTASQQPLPGDISLDDLDPQQREQAEAMIQEMAQVREQVANTPAIQIIANHVMGFYELAAIHLSQTPPNFNEATLAIDAMDAVLTKVGDKMGDDGASLRQGLSQLQMAFVELKNNES